MQTPSPLCDFEQWINTEIEPEDKEWMQKLLWWEVEDTEMMEKRHREEGCRKGAQGRGGKEACCYVQGGEGEEA